MLATRSRLGYSMLGLLAALAVMLILFGVMYGILTRDEEVVAPTRPGGPTTTLPRSVEQGREVACRNNLSQVRMAVRMEMENDAENATPPATLRNLGSYGIMDSMLKCPVTGQDYRYDPRTGQVSCPTQGHEAY